MIHCRYEQDLSQLGCRPGLVLPAILHEFVPDHVAHFIRDLVRDELDLTAILSSYDDERGFPPYHPGMMVAVLPYAYTQGFIHRGALRAAARSVWTPWL